MEMHQYHIVSRIAIYLLAVVMIIFGVYYFINPHDLFVYIPSIPGGILWAYFVGAAFILVGISFITNQYVKFAGYLLAGLLFIFVLGVHFPNWLNAGDKEMKAMALINILKDTAIAAFALHIAAGAHHQHLHLEDSD
jgi:putative oxidoreductase